MARALRYCLVFLFFYVHAFAQNAIALDGEIKYKDLHHFDYVNPNAKKGGTLRTHAIGTFDTLNPFLLQGNPAQGLELLYDTLMVQSLDEPYSQYGLIADSIQIAKDYFSVIFHINPLAKFSDGVSVSALDVKFSFDTLRSKGSILFAQYYADVKEARVLDSQNIEFVFKTNQNRELPLILGQLQILPRHFYLKNGKNTFGEDVLQKPLGSGPYHVGRYELGKRIQYVRNKDYWAKDLPVMRGMFNFDQVVFEYYKDESVALRAFLKGDYDWRFESVAKIWARGYVGKALEENQIHKIMLKNSLPSGFQGFFMNTRRKIFQNPLVREAMLYAFDAEWSNKNLFFSQYQRTQSYFNGSIFAMPKQITKEEREILQPYEPLLRAKYPRIYEDFKMPRTDGREILGENRRKNLKYARDLLQQAGYEIKDFKLIDTKTKQPFVFTLLLNHPAFERLASAYAKNLEVLGIKMEIKILDVSRYNALVRDFDYDMIVGVIGQSLFPGNEQAYYFGSKSADAKGSKNYAGIKDPIVDDLIKRLIQSKNSQEQMHLTRALDRVLSWGFYAIAHFNLPYYRIALWDQIKMPKNAPLYGLTPYVWWMEE